MFTGFTELEGHQKDFFEDYSSEKAALEKFIIENGKTRITVGEKAAAIGCLEMQFRKIDESASINQELNTLADFWLKQPANHDLKQYQQDFLSIIQKMIINEHSDLSDFNKPNQSLDEKLQKLEAITLMNLDLKNKSHRDTVIYLYFYYLSLYKLYLSKPLHELFL